MREADVIHGYCRQDGVPTPDNPIPIETYIIEKSADKLFEELGYKKETFKEDRCYLLRFKKDNDNVIYFERDKTFHKSGEYDGMHDSISMQELKAINMKCRELGWSDE